MKDKTPARSVGDTPPSRDDFARVAKMHRRALKLHCYRMLGSLHEAEDAVQETMLRAWRGFDDFEARASNEINQTSGVSVRVTINNLESLISNAEKRTIINGDSEIVPRLSDLHALYASTAGKLELEYVGEDKK